MQKRIIGLHLRLNNRYDALALHARDLKIQAFQFFLVPQKQKTYLPIRLDDQKRFCSLRQELFKSVFVHCSYWINLASGKPETVKISKGLLLKECSMAEQLAVHYVVLHPGSAKTQKGNGFIQKKLNGIATLAQTLNEVLPQTPSTILLENNAHGNATIGSDLHDFTRLKKQLGHPNNLKFCLDLSHSLLAPEL